MSGLTGYLTRTGADLSSVFLNTTSLIQKVTTGTQSGSTSYTIPYPYPWYPGQIICYTNGATYSGVIIVNIYWGSYSQTLSPTVKIGNAFSTITSAYTTTEHITITMNTSVSQAITYIFKQF